jgi:HK97 family phage prohead protease
MDALTTRKNTTESKPDDGSERSSPPAGIERRSFVIETPEIREAEGDRPARIEGLAVPYNRWTTIGGMFREMVEPGAFRAYLADPANDVRYNYGHHRLNIMGRRSSGTLRVEDRDDGVHVSLDVPDTQLGRDMLVLVRRGDLQGHSMEFYAVGERWDYARDGSGELDRRTITEAKLPGVALVDDGAYQDTTVALRHREAYRDDPDGSQTDGSRPDADEIRETMRMEAERKMRRLRLARAHASMEGLA